MGIIKKFVGLALTLEVGLGGAFPVLAIELALDQRQAVDEVLLQEEVTLDDLATNPGLLSTNPFYFIKKLRRSAQRLLALNALKRAELELGILDQKAAELKTMSAADSSTDDLFLGLSEYEKTLMRFYQAANNLKRDLDPAAKDNFLNRLIDRSIKHLKLLAEFRAANQSVGEERITRLEKDLWGEVLAGAVTLDEPQNFQIRWLAIAANQRGSVLKDWLAAEILDRAVVKLMSSASYGNLLFLKESLLLKAENRLKFSAGDLDVTLALSKLPGDLGLRIKILDEFREYSLDADWRNQLSSIREQLFEIAVQSRSIGKSEAEQMIKEVKSLLAELPEVAPKDSVWKGLAARAEFNLKQSEASLENSQYANAFGQASVAAAAIQNALLQIFHRNNLEEELAGLKLEYDRLAVSSDKDAIEKNLVKAADWAKDKNSRVSDLTAYLRGIRSALQQLELEREQVKEKTHQSLLQRLLAK